MSIQFIKKEWSDVHRKKYDWLYNYIKTIEPKAKKDNFINIYKHQLLKLIDDNKNWGAGSKENLYFMVARWLYNEQDKYSKMFSDAGFNLLQISREKEGNNLLDTKEQINFRPYIYFINLLKAIDIKTIRTETDHYKYLLLNMLVFQPPLRTSFYNSAKVIKTISENDNINNFILINKRGKLKVSYIINNDKAKNYRLYSINKNLSKIDLADEKLELLINNSFIQYPRKYLFEVNKKPVSQETILNWLRCITMVPGINIDIMRSSYITNFYSENLNFNSREKLSKIMRHSVQVQSKNYYKIFELENEPAKDPKYNEINVKLEMKIKELETKLNNYTANDISGDNKLYNKQKRDVLYNLNTKRREPRQQTLDKYNIKLNLEGTKYI